MGEQDASQAVFESSLRGERNPRSLLIDCYFLDYCPLFFFSSSASSVSPSSLKRCQTGKPPTTVAAACEGEKRSPRVSPDGLRTVQQADKTLETHPVQSNLPVSSAKPPELRLEAGKDLGDVRRNEREEQDGLGSKGEDVGSGLYSSNAEDDLEERADPGDNSEDPVVRGKGEEELDDEKGDGEGGCWKRVELVDVTRYTKACGGLRARCETTRADRRKRLTGVSAEVEPVDHNLGLSKGRKVSLLSRSPHLLNDRQCYSRVPIPSSPPGASPPTASWPAQRTWAG